MKTGTSVAAQVILLTATLAITGLRCYVRLSIESRPFNISDYFIWAGCVFAIIFSALQCKAIYVEMDHPLSVFGFSDSVVYLKSVFASSLFFDLGLYMPKFSITAFYWWLIPPSFTRLRIALYISTGFLGLATLAAILTDFLISQPFSSNWTIEKQADSIWNSYIDMSIEWALNFSADLILFFIPFFVIGNLKLRRRQTISLIGVFSLGAITMVMTVTRFLLYTVASGEYSLSDADGAVLCVAEMCTGIIVANLPGLKVLVTKVIKSDSQKSKSGQSKNGQSKNGYNYSVGVEPSSRANKLSGKLGRPRPDDDSEVELISITDHKGRLASPAHITVQQDVSVERTNKNTGSSVSVAEHSYV